MMSDSSTDGEHPSWVPPPLPRRLRLRNVLFLMLLVPALAPLLSVSFYLTNRNQNLQKTRDLVQLTTSAQNFVQSLSDDLAHLKGLLQQVGKGLLAAPNDGSLAERLRQPWVSEFLLEFVEERRDLVSFHVVDIRGNGLKFEPAGSDEATQGLMREAFFAARGSEKVVYRFAVLPGGFEPAVVVAVPIQLPEEGDACVLQALVRLDLETSAARSSSDVETEELFLVDTDGSLLWSAGRRPEAEQALMESDLLLDFKRALYLSREYELLIGGETVRTVARVVPVAETGWGVVAHKPADVAFQQVQEIFYKTALASILAVILALALALVASRWFSAPIQRLAETSHEIAAGNFDQRVEVTGLTLEVADLAEDFNRMSEYVENYVAQLKQAAAANRQLFISSIRAFAAAIDAKDPYTRGHSERVAAYSRSIARYLGLPRDAQEKVWISAVLHDIGKIGVNDRVLQKGGVLTTDEFDQMKQHPVIGADIVEPISALREMMPGIRWHHEAWNGSGYPDGLKAEQIPLMARIIGVADTFDAITTNRPYQKAFSITYALDTIKKLTGTRFDAKIVTAFLLAWEAGHLEMDREKAEQREATLRPSEPASN